MVTTSIKLKTTLNFTQQAINVFRDCSLITTLSRARIIPRKGGCYEVEATWSQRDLERGKSVAFTESYFVRRTSGHILEKICNSTFPANATQVLKISYSCDCSVKAVLVSDKTAKAEPYSKPQQYIEIWSESKLSKTIDVKSLKRHGPINEDIHFGSFQLSADGSHLFYIAEREKPESCSFFKKPSDEEKDKNAPIQGAEYVYETSWGEQLSSVVNPIPVVLNLCTEECTVLNTSQVGDISCGQAHWVPSDDGGLIFVGWENKPRKLGLVYCPTRRSSLYYWKKGEFSRLTDGVHSVFSPRFNPQGDRLVYFESITDWAHHTCAALKMIEWDSKAVTTVIDIVRKPQSPGAFAGYYAELLPERCWDSTGRKVVSDENWGSAKVVMCADVENRKVTKITSATDKPGAWSVLDVSDNIIVAGYSSPTSAPQLLIGILPDDTAAPITWAPLSVSESNPIFADLSWELLYFHPDGSSGLHYEAILLSPKVSPFGASPPLAVVPHGGPNDIYSTQFSVWPTCLAALGFAVLQVNYRGSTGLGQDSIDSLPGKDGTQDVGDVHAAVLSLVDKGIVNKNAVVAFGISHGGFLTTQLVVQYPDFYKAASVHNPVENFATMSGTSDIPDWCYVQAGVKYDPTLPPTSKDYTELLSHSPMSGYDKIKAPVLIHLGTEDLRVPNSQGMSLYHTLKARNLETKLLLYPGDCHPINSVSSDADSFVNTAAWFFCHSLKTED